MALSELEHFFFYDNGRILTPSGFYFKDASVDINLQRLTTNGGVIHFPLKYRAIKPIGLDVSLRNSFSFYPSNLLEFYISVRRYILGIKDVISVSIKERDITINQGFKLVDALSISSKTIYELSNTLFENKNGFEVIEINLPYFYIKLVSYKGITMTEDLDDLYPSKKALVLNVNSEPVSLPSTGRFVADHYSPVSLDETIGFLFNHVQDLDEIYNKLNLIYGRTGLQSRIFTIKELAKWFIVTRAKSGSNCHDLNSVLLNFFNFPYDEFKQILGEKKTNIFLNKLKDY